MQRFETYKIKRGVDLADPDFWNPILKELDLRLHQRELDADKINNAAAELVAVGVARVNETFNPLITAATQSVNDATDLLHEAQQEVADTIATTTTGFNEAIAASNAALDQFIEDSTAAIAAALNGTIDDGTF